MEKTKNKIVITGASGFIGRHLLQDIDTSLFDIRLITRDVKKKINGIPEGTEIVEADLCNIDSLQKAFSGIDIVINCAAEVRNVSQLERTNILGTKNLIQAAIDNGVSKIVHLSSVGVVGAQYSASFFNVDEQAICAPKNEYERTKLESERLLIEAKKQHHFSLSILRPTNVFGEYHPYNALLNLITKINNEKTLPYTSDAFVNYVYVKDLTRLIIEVAMSDKERGIVNVGSSLKLEDFLVMIAKELGKKSHKIQISNVIIQLIALFGIKKLHAISNVTIYDDSKLKSFYTYPFGLEKGIASTIKHYKEQNLVE